MKHLKRFNEIKSSWLVEGKLMKSQGFDSDVKKEAFRDKVKDFLKSKGCKISQVGDDFEVHLDTEDVLQIMFRNDKMTVRKEGNKFGKEFKYNEFGNIKKEISKIIRTNENKNENINRDNVLYIMKNHFGWNRNDEYVINKLNDFENSEYYENSKSDMECAERFHFYLKGKI
jgi:hypothetical protein